MRIDGVERGPSARVTSTADDDRIASKSRRNHRVSVVDRYPPRSDRDASSRWINVVIYHVPAGTRRLRRRSDSGRDRRIFPLSPTIHQSRTPGATDPAAPARYKYSSDETGRAKYHTLCALERTIRLSRSSPPSRPRALTLTSLSEVAPKPPTPVATFSTRRRKLRTHESRGTVRNICFVDLGRPSRHLSRPVFPSRWRAARREIRAHVSRSRRRVVVPAVMISGRDDPSS